MDIRYHCFLPQHTGNTHRVFAVVDHGSGETLEALATFPTAERADAIADLLNLLTAGNPPRGTRERLQAALEAEPGPVKAAVSSLMDSLHPWTHALGLRLERRASAAIATFPTSGCPAGGCGSCSRCAEGCADCPTCDSGECEQCLAPPVTPRTAYLLHAAAQIVGDELAMAVEDPGGWDEFPPFVQHLPPAAMDQFHTAFFALAADLAHGVEPRPRTTAEEIALDLITNYAETLLEVGTFDDRLACLPGSAADYDWEAILDLLYQDNDYTNLMAHPGPLTAETVDRLFEHFNNMPSRPYPAFVK